MYQPVRVYNEHRSYQRILLRNNVTEPIHHYKMTKVTFNLANSPYLVIKSVQQLTSDENVESLVRYYPQFLR